MASSGNPSRWDELPDELLLQILSYLEPYHVTKLQLVCRRLRELCLDDELWKLLSFENSQWYQSLQNRRSIFRPLAERHGDTSHHDTMQIDADAGSSPANAIYQDDFPTTCSLTSRSRKLQDMANWDPVFPGERVSWYDEYVQRHGPTCVNWLQTPRLYDYGVEVTIEARGMALYSPHDGSDGVGTMLAVSPLDDGSVCLWDINGTRGRQGCILAASNPGILFIDGPGDQNSKRSKKIDTGVTECVSVDNHGHRAFFAVQSHLIEVDLNRLEVVSRESFEWSITTLSALHQGVPLTVGTSLGVHLHDFRMRAMASRDIVERLDVIQWDEPNVFKMIFDTKPLPPYASLSQPTPISILHLPRPGSHNLVSDDIYVAGRFSNILHYDRRKFPAIEGSIYSGALIKSLAALPYPFSAVDTEVRRQGDLTTEQVAQLKFEGEGRTLIAAGGYKSKGSLEIYGLSSAAGAGEKSILQNSVTKNRQTVASSTILSVANHGSKIVFSDGSGFIKWFERDGSTECRRMRIGHSDAEEASSLFASMAGSDDMARKIVSTKSNQGNDRPNNDNILLWTGEKLGLVSFTKSPIFDRKDFELQDPETSVENERRKEYTHRMRRALERQADEVKFIGSLGDPAYWTR
ncbi:F-box domain containing protein, partial [Metarhizium majus ARSEF 297]